jgi:predicted O-linked N-acetylglucosamine transferase (SPINDLY family)
MSAWCTDDVDAYVARAISAAADLDGLAACRAGIRERMRAGPLCDGPGLAKAMEDAFAAMRQMAVSA